MLTGLAPLVSRRTRVLILGSFPGVASLAAQQYYGHPQNQFWKILQAIWPSSPIPVGVDSYQSRSEWLLDRQLGVWDVYAACEREGSLDSRIRQPVVNDFAQMLQQCPALEVIAHNGGESFKHARKIAPTLATSCAAQPPEGAISPWGGPAAKCRETAIAFYQLPSTSPANASWTFERKLAAWRDVFEKHRLTD
ncbi:DNA-deoxyinosine glycosylase [Polaromonas sp. AER18D-145]|uniref:DNA-deoxyinosine glycosylase n=1 Tax=Polaromonas sp. AER18D-145 TaxID=1977060 RepID=UPI000BBBFA55|nr:DNA-deoxyinosine glycosylase [Polaromonas sp. AER18D-145]